MEYYTSTDFAKAIGVSKSTVIAWDKKGIIVPAKRTITGRRLYSQEQLQAYMHEEYDSPILKEKEV